MHKPAPSRKPRIRDAVQVAVDFAFDFASAKQALRALDKCCTHSELSDTAPLASAIRLLVFYAYFTPDCVPHENRASRLVGLKSGIKLLAALMLGHVAPSPVNEDKGDDTPIAPDFKKRAAGDSNE